MLKQQSKAMFETLDDAVSTLRPRLDRSEVGRVVSIGHGVALVRGFTQLRASELVQFSNGELGLASSINEKEIGVIVLGPCTPLREGTQVRRTRRIVDAPVGRELLGRVVDALGRALDERGHIATTQRRAVEQPAPAIMHRAPVRTPLQTGIKAIDAAIPVGRGQRELIIGDRQTGKTSIAVDTIVNQRESGVISIYCAIGQRASAVARVIAVLRDNGALERSIVVVASGDDAPGLQYIAPYAATTMAEHFMQNGEDVVIVYDDLTRHARAYRELSLLLRRPPGREAYPGDIFYLHSRLLERATQLRQDHGGGSLSALPIIETQASNISAYVPTNLISITDGQIYLSSSLFEKGQLPAIDIGQSVSRVGGKAQLASLRAIAGDLRLAYAQYEELESFARFGTRLDEQTRSRLERGRRVREVLKQLEHKPLSVVEQIAVLLATTNGLFDHINLEDVAHAEDIICQTLEQNLPALSQRIMTGAPLHADDREELLATMRDALHRQCQPTSGGEQDGYT